jgi:hypothetical protein
MFPLEIGFRETLYNAPQNLDKELRRETGLPRVGKEVFRDEERAQEVRWSI